MNELIKFKDKKILEIKKCLFDFKSMEDPDHPFHGAKVKEIIDLKYNNKNNLNDYVQSIALWLQYQDVILFYMEPNSRESASSYNILLPLDITPNLYKQVVWNRMYLDDGILLDDFIIYLADIESDIQDELYNIFD